MARSILRRWSRYSLENHHGWHDALERRPPGALHPRRVDGREDEHQQPEGSRGGGLFARLSMGSRLREGEKNLRLCGFCLSRRQSLRGAGRSRASGAGFFFCGGSRDGGLRRLSLSLSVIKWRGSFSRASCLHTHAILNAPLRHRTSSLRIPSDVVPTPPALLCHHTHTPRATEHSPSSSSSSSRPLEKPRRARSAFVLGGMHAARRLVMAAQAERAGGPIAASMRRSVGAVRLGRRRSSRARPPRRRP